MIMNLPSSCFAALAGLTVAAAALFAAPAPTVAATAAEQLYAELAKLPQAEREKRLVEGAAKENKFVVRPVFRGQGAREHNGIFQKRYPTAKLETLDQGNTEVGVELMIAEEKVGKHLTDSMGLNSPDLDQLTNRGLLAVYQTPVIENILPRYRGFLDPQNRWIPWNWIEHGATYNSNLLKPEDAPKSYMDFCDPKYKGQNSLDPGEPKWLAGVYLMMGEETFTKWLECIAKNEPVIQSGHTVRMELMLAGDHALSMDSFFYRGFDLNKKNPRRAPFAIDWDVPILAFSSVQGINKNTAQPYGSALFSDWLLSEENQKYLYSIYRGPLTIAHPMIKDDAEIFIYGPVKEDVLKKVSELYLAKIGRKK
jgi:iron(III) transport system substrate-binding protein